MVHIQCQECWGTYMGVMYQRGTNRPHMACPECGMVRTLTVLEEALHRTNQLPLFDGLNIVLGDNPMWSGVPEQKKKAV